MMEGTSSSTLSGQQSLQQQGAAEPAAGDEEGSVDQVCQVQDPVTRHYKRRRSNSVARLGDPATLPPLAQVEDPSMVAARMSILQIYGKEGIEGRREELPTKTVIGACMINSAPVQTDPESEIALQYLEYLTAGSGGFTTEEFSASFQSQTAFPSEQVRSYLKNNPIIDEVMLETSPSPTTISDPADPQPDDGRPGVRTRSKAHKTKIESVQPKSVEKMQQSTGNLQMVSASNDVTAADPTDSQQATHARFKYLSDTEAQLIDGGKPYLGSLQAMQAKILAERGFQKGVPCARKDVARKWWCPLLAMAGDTLCEHHKAKSRASYARRKLRKRSGSTGPKSAELETGRSMELIVMQPASTEIMQPQPKLEDPAASVTEVEEEAKAEALVNVHVNRSVPGTLKSLHAKICAEKGDESGVRCGRKGRPKDGTKKRWQCPMNAMKGHTLSDHHYFLQNEYKKRSKAAAKLQGNSDFKNANNNDVGLQSGSHTQIFRDQVSAEMPQLSTLPLKPSIDTPSQAASDEKLDHTEAPDTADEISEDDHDDHTNSDADQLLPHMLKNAFKRWYVAPRKTADHANVKVNSHDRESSSGLILSPMIPPQPAMNGGGRKAQLFKSLLESL